MSKRQIWNGTREEWLADQAAKGATRRALLDVMVFLGGRDRDFAESLIRFQGDYSAKQLHWVKELTKRGQDTKEQKK